jgi:hypothetical protein
METLRNFAENVLSDSSKPNSIPYYSKPEVFSNTFELRCLSTPGNTRPRTDFHEFYWQHLMPNAKWSNIADWTWFMMRRPLNAVPAQLVLLWWLLWLGIIIFLFIVFVLYLRNFFYSSQTSQTVLQVPLLAALVWLIIQGAILAYIGDAATYLRAHPRNVASRHKIRATGVALIHKLQSSNQYDRIIIVGHSLGSVIGYDIINLAWQKYSARHGSPCNPSSLCLKKAESLAYQMHELVEKGDSVPVAFTTAWKQCVRDVALEMRLNNHPWLITDFVTLGSPLAHADLLMARNRDDLNQKFSQLELPKSPPILNSKRRFTKPFTYSLPDGSRRTTYLPHHAAWTACVQWTNLYFPCHWFLKGDFIGGPLASIFGVGILDVPVVTTLNRGWFSHTLYWAIDHKQVNRKTNSLLQLRHALDLKSKAYKS